MMARVSGEPVFPQHPVLNGRDEQRADCPGTGACCVGEWDHATSISQSLSTDSVVSPPWLSDPFVFPSIVDGA